MPFPAEIEDALKQYDRSRGVMRKHWRWRAENHPSIQALRELLFENSSEFEDPTKAVAILRCFLGEKEPKEGKASYEVFKEVVKFLLRSSNELLPTDEDVISYIKIIEILERHSLLIPENIKIFYSFGSSAYHREPHKLSKIANTLMKCDKKGILELKQIRENLKVISIGDLVNNISYLNNMRLWSMPLIQNMICPKFNGHPFSRLTR